MFVDSAIGFCFVCRRKWQSQDTQHKGQIALFVSFIFVCLYFVLKTPSAASGRGYAPPTPKTMYSPCEFLRRNALRTGTANFSTYFLNLGLKTKRNLIKDVSRFKKMYTYIIRLCVGLRWDCARRSLLGSELRHTDRCQVQKSKDKRSRRRALHKVGGGSRLTAVVAPPVGAAATPAAASSAPAVRAAVAASVTAAAVATATT